MKTLAALAVLVACALSGPLAAQTRDGLTLTHAEPLRGLEITPLAGNTGRLEAMHLRFEALGRAFDLDLEPNTALLSSPEAVRLARGLERPDGGEHHAGRINAPPRLGLPGFRQPFRTTPGNAVSTASTAAPPRFSSL